MQKSREVRRGQILLHCIIQHIPSELFKTVMLVSSFSLSLSFQIM